MKPQPTPLQQQWLQMQYDSATQPCLKKRYPLCIDRQKIGSVEAGFVAQLSPEDLAARAISLQLDGLCWHLTGDGSATQRLHQLAQLMRENGLTGAWRDEQLAVCSEQGQRLATVERGAVRPLGIATRAVHLVGVSSRGGIWAQQRAHDKATHPGMWDTLMGGMVSAQDTLHEALARETWEEAGLHVKHLQALQHGGYVAFSRPSEDAQGRGYMQERIDWFSAVVPDAQRPQNQDGEVQRFELLDPETLAQWLLQGQFTPEASLILAAHLGWASAG